jgi:uncharacterized protein (DUF2252 family)
VIIAQIEERERDRTQAFCEFARRRATGAVVFSPAQLGDEDRRLYVRQTLREDHRHRIHNQPEGAQAKFDKLAKSPFVFFRGTALLFYRDYAGTDVEFPSVFVVGDVHPENFGVMPNDDGAPFFGIDDYDEACFAPFSWDLRRGVTGFCLSCRELGYERKARKRVVRRFVEGYLRGLLEFARNDREKWHEFRLDNSPPLIRDLIDDSLKSRRRFLASLVDLEKGRFLSTEEIVPHSKQRAKFQEIVDRYRQSAQVSEEAHGGHFQVKDVAIKTGSGTASLGLERYFVLIDGESSDPADDIILEIKQARRSALYGLTPNTRQAEGEAERIVEAHQIHVAGGDRYYGQVEIDGTSFLVRERSPFKAKIDLEKLDEKSMGDYADICGVVLAQVHARSDEDTGVEGEGQAEQRILSSIRPKLFVDDMVRFSEVAGSRVIGDYRHFRKDHALQAFNLSMQSRPKRSFAPDPPRRRDKARQ